MVGMLDQTAGIQNLQPGADGEFKINTTDTGIGASVGLLIETDEHTRLGVTYVSPVSLDFPGFLISTGGYTFGWSGDLPVDQFRGPLVGRVSGEFASSALHFLAVGFEWKM